MAKKRKQRKHSFINESAIRDYAKTRGRRVGRDFLDMVNDHLARKLDIACGVKNGGKKTMDEDVAIYSGFTVFKREGGQND